MALINCPECDAKISDKAPACVRCGAPIMTATEPETPLQELLLAQSKAQSGTGHKVEIIVVVFGLIGGIIGFILRPSIPLAWAASASDSFD